MIVADDERTAIFPGGGECCEEGVGRRRVEGRGGGGDGEMWKECEWCPGEGRGRGR